MTTVAIAMYCVERKENKKIKNMVSGGKVMQSLVFVHPQTVTSCICTIQTEGLCWFQFTFSDGMASIYDLYITKVICCSYIVALICSTVSDLFSHFATY